MEGKKISFGFMKTKKVEKPIVEEKKDFIECLEEKAIKVVGGEQEEDNEPLVIPMKPNTLITAERLREIAEKVESGLDEVMPMPSKENNGEIKTEPTENLTLDQLAVKELLQEAKKEVKVEQQELTVPIPAKPVIDGQKESTLEDYESVPIQDFGMAMLRGMGWTANKEQLAKYKPPALRPKGLGLGADKVINDKQKKKTVNKDGKEEELSIVKNSYVKIIAGKHSGYYGKVVSLDEENGRVMVDITMKKETVSLSEFMMQPVTKAEFDKESKVINSGAYEEYKTNESSRNKQSSRNESPNVPEKQRHDSPNVNSREASSSQRSKDKQEREIKEESRRNNDKGSNGRDKSRQERSRRNSSNEEDNRSNKNEYIRDSSSEDRNRRNRRDKPRNSSEERDSRRKAEKSRRDSSSSDDRKSRRKKEKSKRDSSSSEEDKKYRKKKSKSKRDSSSEDRDRSNRRKKEASKRYSSEERGKRRLEKEKKRYSSNESLESISDSEKKKNKRDRRRKDSSESELEDCRKKDRKDIDKKRKGKKKKRDRDRSPNYKKYKK